MKLACSRPVLSVVFYLACDYDQSYMAGQEWCPVGNIISDGSSVLLNESIMKSTLWVTLSSIFWFVGEHAVSLIHLCWRVSACSLNIVYFSIFSLWCLHLFMGWCKFLREFSSLGQNCTEIDYVALGSVCVWRSRPAALAFIVWQRRENVVGVTFWIYILDPPPETWIFSFSGLFHQIHFSRWHAHFHPLPCVLVFSVPIQFEF